jgi:hypothetical protein
MTAPTPGPLGIVTLNHKGEVLIVMTQATAIITFEPAEAEKFAKSIVDAAKAAAAGEPPAIKQQQH